jgi:hypothetical protein
MKNPLGAPDSICIYANYLYTPPEVVIIRFLSLTQPKWIPKVVKHNRSGMVAVLGPFEALPYYIYIYIPKVVAISKRQQKLKRII